MDNECNAGLIINFYRFCIGYLDLNKIAVPKYDHCLQKLEGVLFNITRAGCLGLSGSKSSQAASAREVKSLSRLRNKRLAENIDLKQNSHISSDSPVTDHGITTFVSDETSKIATVESPADIMESFKSSNRINGRQDIVDFLRRPQILWEGLLQTSDGPTTFSTIDVPDYFLYNDQVAPKIQGFLGIRATYVATLQVNANRFVQGRYLLNFYPCGGAVDATQSSGFRQFHEFSLVQRTAVPGIQIDLNTETQVTLRIPFSMPYLYSPIRSATTLASIRQLGQIRLCPYVATNVNIGATLWGYLEDVELFIPTFPQSSMRGFSDTEKEQKSANIGPVESFSRAVSKSTDHFVNVPFLSSYVTPVKWAADIVAGVASVFGWSKPTISTPIAILAKNRGYQNVNVDGADMSVKMSLSVANQVVTVPGLTGSDLDEMSFDYIKKVPAFFKNLSWSTQTTQSFLYGFNLNPSSFGQTFTDNGNSVICYPPCCIPLTNFSSYRGGFKVKIKAVKTEFHSGRLAIVFAPGNTNGLGVPTTTYDVTHWANRHIIDIRYGTEWEFEFPFTSEFTYLSTTTAYGAVYVVVENQLSAPPTVSGTVNLLFEVYGADDLEYAVPKPSPSLYVYKPVSPQSSAGQFNAEMLSSSIGATKKSTWNVDYCKASIGEKFTSYRQLVKKFDMRARKSVYGPDQCTFYLPFLVSYVEGNSGSGTPTLPILQPDTYSLVSTMFAISRGGVRVKFYDYKPGANGSVFVFTDTLKVDTKTEFGTSPNSFSGAKPGPALAIGGLAAQVPVLDGLTAETQYPMYAGALGYPVADVCSNPATNGLNYRVQASSAPETITTLMQTNTANTTSAPFVLRAAADDFSLHGFISVPPLINLSSGDTYVSQGWAT